MRKSYATTGRAQRRNFPENLRRPAPSRIRMEYMSIDGTVTMILRVVAPQTPCDDRWILRRPPNPNLFLLASLNLEGEIHLKGGRFVTSQIFNLECYTIYHHCISYFIAFWLILEILRNSRTLGERVGDFVIFIFECRCTRIGVP